jgi:hypothetical protein
MNWKHAMSKEVIDLAGKIAAKAEDALSGLDREMRSWPPEFREIMWGAVAQVALKRQAEAQAMVKAP